jgi:hypothetical protein
MSDSKQSPLERFFAVTAPGLKQVAAQELLALGFAAIPPDGDAPAGGVEFDGELSDLYRANLHLRSVNRVLLRLGQFYAAAFSELRKKAAACPGSAGSAPAAAGFARDLPQISPVPFRRGSRARGWRHRRSPGASPSPGILRPAAPASLCLNWSWCAWSVTCAPSASTPPARAAPARLPLGHCQSAPARNPGSRHAVGQRLGWLGSPVGPFLRLGRYPHRGRLPGPKFGARTPAALCLHGLARL